MADLEILGKAQGKCIEEQVKEKEVRGGVV
jgi:hypothetical protein